MHSNRLLIGLIALLFMPTLALADLVVRGTRATAPTVAGNQTYTVSDFNGNTPVAAQFVYSSGVVGTDGVVNSGLSFGVGVTDCTNQWALSWTQRDGQLTPTNQRGGSIQKVITIRDVNDPATEVASASLVSCTANSVTVNWSSVSGIQEQISVVMYGGGDITPFAGTIDVSSTIGGDVIVDTGLQVDLMFFAAPCFGLTGNDFTFNSLNISLGVARREGSKQMSVNLTAHDSNMPTQVASIFRNNRVLEAIDLNTFGRCMELEVLNWTTTGMTLRNHASTGWWGKTVFYLAFALEGAHQVDIVNVQIPPSTGPQSWSGLAFQPQSAIILGSANATANNLEESDAIQHETIAFGYFDETGTETTNSFFTQDALASTNVGTVNNAKMLHAPGRQSQTLYEMDFVSVTPDAVNFNLNVAPAFSMNAVLVTFSGGMAPTTSRRRVSPYTVD